VRRSSSSHPGVRTPQRAELMAHRNGYSAKTKEAALKTLERDGIWAAVAQTGVHHTTLYRWHAAYVRSLEQTDEEIAEQNQEQQALRSHVRQRLLEAAAAHLDRSDNCKNGNDAKNFMTAAAIALDKFRLEMGEHTGYERRETGMGAAEIAQQRVDELAERRHKSA
jgi:hypothetical protein